MFNANPKINLEDYLMKKTFDTILQSYLVESNKELTDNPIAKFLRHEACEIIEKYASINLNKYKVQGSSGNGRWVTVPWVAFFGYYYYPIGWCEGRDSNPRNPSISDLKSDAFNLAGQPSQMCFF